MKPEELKQKAQDITNTLRGHYKGDKFSLDVAAVPYLSGKDKQLLRREIILQVTGQQPRPKDCTISAVIDQLKNSFDQLKLF